MQHGGVIHILRGRFAAAVARVTGAAPAEVDPQVRPAGDPKFGDYQCNAAMSLARTLGARPREVAQRIVDAVDLEGIAEPPQIAGPGFINIRLSADFLARYLSAIPGPARPNGGSGKETERREDGESLCGRSGQATQPADAGAAALEPDRLGMPPVPTPRRVVIDYSSPNIAKQMHVGHLRSTIIGDVFARVLEFEGHEVIRQNHVGDWGTQFGLLIAYYADHPLPTPQTHADVLDAIEEDYRAAVERDRTDAAFHEAARAAVGRLQAGDADARRVWERLCAQSRQAFLDSYRRLNVRLTDEDVRGESFYNDRLAAVVAELRARLPPRDKRRPADGPYAELRRDAGAVCLFFYDERHAPRFRRPDGGELPMIIQKSDGAYLYATTDLAALRYRILELGATRVIYVTDARQKLHFEMLFAAARAAGWAGADVLLEHATFGSVLGEDRRPLKTREGKNVKLRELLDEAERRALAVLEARSDEEAELTAAALSEREKREIARRVGVAAVKYADLRNDRVSDYVFDWDKLLALQGNTAPYMLYAYARVRSIYRRAAERIGRPDAYVPGTRIVPEQPAERALALRLARLRETIDTVSAELAPHALCTYLYELAADFMRFYETCPVLQAPDAQTRLSRLRLCDLTARTLKLGLGLLGIETIERM